MYRVIVIKRVERCWLAATLATLVLGLCSCDGVAGVAGTTGLLDQPRQVQSSSTSTRSVGAACSLASECVSGQCGGGVCIEQTILSTGFYHAGTGWRLYQLVRVTTAPDRHTYVQWFPPPRSRRGQAPVVVTSAPYDGVNWTGDPVDAKWAARRGARWGYRWPDEDGPGFDPQTSADIVYLLSSPKDSAGHVGGFLANDVGVLQVFSRFYAGRTMTDYAEDMVAGLRMLDVDERVKRDAIGIYGVSLGGFEAIHGAVRAPPSVRPALGAAWAPPLDPEAFSRYAQQVIPSRLDADDPKLAEYREFFDPYVRRIEAASGGLHTTSALAAELQTPFLLFHDAWDTLVPISMSENLAAASPIVDGFWFPHGSDIDYGTFALEHQQPTEPITATVVLTFSHAYLLTALSEQQATINIFYAVDELSAAMQHLRARQTAGTDIQWLVPRLLELADARVVMHEFYGAAAPVAGCDLVGSLLNELWTANLDPASFCTEVPAFLHANGLPL